MVEKKPIRCAVLDILTINRFDRGEEREKKNRGFDNTTQVLVVVAAVITGFLAGHAAKLPFNLR